MFTKYTLTMITILLAMAMTTMAGCSITTPTTPSSNAGPENSQSNPSGTYTETNTTNEYQMLPVISGKVANLKLDASADGTTQQLKVGEVMSISLESNPSTGYSWFARIPNDHILAQMGEPEYQQPSFDSATPMVGAPGTVTIFFEAFEAGNATITLEYMREFETDVAPEKTITITVEVK